MNDDKDLQVVEVETKEEKSRFDVLQEYENLSIRMDKVLEKIAERKRQKAG